MAEGEPKAGRTAVVVGSSDGIGLALSKRLVADGWSVTGVSRSPGRVDEPAYEHVVLDVTSADYIAALSKVCDRLDPIDLCVYCAGIGEFFDADDLAAQGPVFAVNLIGAVATIEVVVARMLASGAGHFIGISSLADQLIVPEACGYAASKAGLSSYLNGLALALRPRNVYVTNVRFGFVDTKMARAPKMPMIISADKAADLLMECVRKRPAQLSHPKPMALATVVMRQISKIKMR
jgi:NAD(P)-dependent dehydrogenase (short-subunit alcohol dehydrogenase family)